MFNETVLNRTNASMHVKNEMVQRRLKENARDMVAWLNDIAHAASEMIKCIFNIARDVNIYYAA